MKFCIKKLKFEYGATRHFNTAQKCLVIVLPIQPTQKSQLGNRIFVADGQTPADYNLPAHENFCCLL